MYAYKLLKPGLDFWSLVARGHQEEGTIGRSTPRNEEIRRTAKDTATVENNPQIRRKGDPSDAPIAQRSDAKSIAPMDMIWKNVKLFWIAKRCHLQQRRHPKIPVGESIAGRSPTETSIWQKST
jgi:hypothetical protein